MYTSFLEIKGRIYINVLLIFIIEKKYFFIDWKSLLEFITTSFFYNWDTLNQVSEVMLQLPHLKSFLTISVSRTMMGFGDVFEYNLYHNVVRSLCRTITGYVF